jgi:hypothetical protein
VRAGAVRNPWYLNPATLWESDPTRVQFLPGVEKHGKQAVPFFHEMGSESKLTQATTSPVIL